MGGRHSVNVNVNAGGGTDSHRGVFMFPLLCINFPGEGHGWFNSQPDGIVYCRMGERPKVSRYAPGPLMDHSIGVNKHAAI